MLGQSGRITKLSSVPRYTSKNVYHRLALIACRSQSVFLLLLACAHAPKWSIGRREKWSSVLGEKESPDRAQLANLLSLFTRLYHT